MARKTNITAKHGETLAVDFLKKKGYHIIKQNYRFGHGEIDIIAKDNDTLVFVEVKTRKSTSFGSPEESVTEKKRQQIKKIANCYLFENNIEEQECRFDVIAVYHYGTKVSLRHYINAF